jgi:hypothetical protein
MTRRCSLPAVMLVEIGADSKLFRSSTALARWFGGAAVEWVSRWASALLVRSPWSPATVSVWVALVVVVCSGVAVEVPRARRWCLWWLGSVVVVLSILLAIMRPVVVGWCFVCRCRSSVSGCASCISVVHRSWMIFVLAIVFHFTTL